MVTLKEIRGCLISVVKVQKREEYFQSLYNPKVNASVRQSDIAKT